MHSPEFIREFTADELVCSFDRDYIKGSGMKKTYRFLILAALIIAALGSYSYGNSAGIFFFIMLGFAFEGLFWFSLFRKKKPSSHVTNISN